MKLKHIALAEAVIIILLSGIIIKMSLEKSPSLHRERLLSSRVYSKLLEPGSLLVVNFAPLKDYLEGYIAKNNLNISVYTENLKSGASFGINEEKEFLPASLTKVLVAILIMRKVERKELNLDTLIDIKDSDRMNSAGTLYLRPEKQLPLKVLLQYMLSESDNTYIRDAAKKALGKLNSKSENHPEK